MNFSNETFDVKRHSGYPVFRLASIMLMIAIVCHPLCLHAQASPKVDAVERAPKVKASEQANPSPSTSKDAANLKLTPSRYITDEEAASYVKSIATSLSIVGRATDPFGQLQDPNVKPAITPSLDKRSQRITQMQATPFVDIVRQIKVTTIMPIEKKFLVGNRSIKQGQQFPINFRNRNINVKVLSVTSRQIEFRNLDNGETASLRLDLLPSGMTPGTKGITAPGMQQNLPNAPLEIGGGGYSSDNSPIANP